MEADKPFIEQMRENVPSGEEVQNAMSDSVENVGSSISDFKESVSDSLNEFSNKSAVDATTEFLDSNTLLAKFSFIILVAILFMVILRIMMVILSYFLAPSLNPYIVKGALSGNDRVIVTQDPSKDDSVSVLKSNDRHRGVEFTWSVWLFLNVTDEALGVQNIFVKGNENFDGNGINLMNGPGLYIESADTEDNVGVNEYKLRILMDHIGGQQTSGMDVGRDEIVIDSIPIRKWVHVAIRMQNTVLDTYINGTIAKRHNMLYAPKQNFNDVVVCGNGGFSGKLADLRYFSYALNVFELNNIVMFGPNTSPSELSIDSKARSGTYSYLSNLWYSSSYA
jgi:hypothetical protein